MQRIQLVEDNVEIANIICEYFNKRDYEVIWSSTGVEGLRDFNSEAPSLMIVDLMLPEMDGYTLCQKIRLISNIPMIILSAKSQCEDKIKGLKLGADDYMTKPFSLAELEARVEAQLSRYLRYEGKVVKNNVLEYKKGLKLDMENRLASLNSLELPLTSKELALLILLAKNPQRTLSKKELYEQVWQELDTEGNNTVTVHIKSLREKLCDDSKTPSYIQTIWGVGYRFIGERLR